MMFERLGKRYDASAKHLHTLSRESIDVAKNLPAERPVLIQAYYTPVMPPEFVEVKADLLGLLKEYEANSSGKIRLNLVPTELYRPRREAEKRFGIEPRRVFSNDEGKQQSAEVFLGIAFTSGVEEVVIPFFDRGLPVEYELTRSIRVVSKSGRKKVGILTTDAKMTGGFDTRSFNQTPEWSIVSELKKQYEVSTVRPIRPFRLISMFFWSGSRRRYAKTDRQSHGLHQKGGRALLFLDPSGRQSAALARSAQDAAGRPVWWRSTTRAQGKPETSARFDWARLAVIGNRLECL